MTERIGIVGAGGQADEAEDFLPKSHEVAFRAVDSKYIDEGDPRQIDIDLLDEEHMRTPVVVAIGAPAIRRALKERWPNEEFHSVISEHAIISESASIGEGCIIGPRAVITTDVKIGSHSIVNIGATVSHGCRFGEFVTVGPGAHIGGNVHLGDGVFIGIGATVKNGITIAEGSVVGSGANVIRDITEPNSVVVGNPAKFNKHNKGWLSEV